METNHLEPCAHFAREPRLWELWRNPIFLRYCRSRLRVKSVLTAVSISLLVTGFIFSMFRTGAISRAEMEVVDAERLALIPIIVIQCIILFFIGTAQCSGGIITERDEGTLDYQRLLPLSPLTKVIGFLFGLPVREWLMFLTTMPFAIWAFWRGQVPFSVMVSVYSALLCCTVLYHLTGLLIGTVVKNRRWAFLFSLGIVFSLYTIIPQLAQYGLFFFKYLGIRPVIEENLSYFAPRAAERTVRLGQKLLTEAPFFGLKLPAAYFTLFCQSGLILAWGLMLYRRWKKEESLLLGKLSAVLLNGWMHLLLLGNALPLIDSGDIFPSRALNRTFRLALGEWKATGAEAVIMSIVYLMLTYVSITFLVNLCTPDREMQLRAWRKARKYGQSRLHPLSDAATSFWATLLMTLIGVAAWFHFTRTLVESRFYPGHFFTPTQGLVVGGILLAVCLGFQAVLEAFGRAKLILLGVLMGIVPIMVATVMSMSSDSLRHAALWIAGVSPFTPLLLSNVSAMTLSSIPEEFSRAVPLVVKFWGSIHLMMAVVWVRKLIRSRREIREAE